MYDWSETTQEIILSAYYYGYTLSHIPGALIAEKFGGKYVLVVGICLTGVFTFLTPNIVANGNF